MKSFLTTLCIVVLSIALFVLCNYVNKFQSHNLSAITFSVSYFCTGWIFKKYYDQKAGLITFLLVTSLMVLSIFYVSDELLFDNISNFVVLFFSFSLGYYIEKFTKILKIISLFFFPVYFLTLNTIRPKIILNNTTLKANFDLFIETKIKNVNLLNYDSSIIPLNIENGRVYLLEFYFKNCGPCQIKEIALKKLEKNFKNEKFSIIYINDGRIDSFETFKNSMDNVKLGSHFYDKDGELSKILNINAYPYEILINNKGKAIYALEGFSEGLEKEYLNRSISLIKELLE